MLNSIFLQNLGSFGNAALHIIPLTKLTIFVGPNNAGKSQAFAAMNIVRHLLSGSLLSWNTLFYSLGSFQEAVHMHDVGRHILVGMKFNGDRQFRYDIYPDNHYSVQYHEGTNLKMESGKIRHTTLEENYVAGTPEIWYFRPLRTLIPDSSRIGRIGEEGWQPIYPDGRNVIQFLLERFNDRDPKWSDAEEWLRKIDPSMKMLKTPLLGEITRAETVRSYGSSDASINMSFQGTGIQNAATIISAIVFSPEGSTICIEEPENFLHSRSQEVIVDLFNYATTELNKQVIFSTHSWSMILPYISDVGKGEKRGSTHVIGNPADFSMVAFNPDSGPNKIQPYSIQDKEFRQVRDDFKKMWG